MSDTATARNGLYKACFFRKVLDCFVTAFEPAIAQYEVTSTR